MLRLEIGMNLFLFCVIFLLFVYFIFSVQFKSIKKSKYPLTPPVKVNGVFQYRIGIIADLDKQAIEKETKSFKSYLKKGFLTYNPSKGLVNVSWDSTPPVLLRSNYGYKGRGMELSDLVAFNEKLYAVDDKTGIIFEIKGDKAIPWVVLPDGNGINSQGFKSEWSCVKDNSLYVGSYGTEWVTKTGEILNYNPMYVKVVKPSGEVKHVDWSKNYKKIREYSAGIKFPGYMAHESGVWSAVHKKWFFLPRRCSHALYVRLRKYIGNCEFLFTGITKKLMKLWVVIYWLWQIIPLLKLLLSTLRTKIELMGFPASNLFPVQRII